MLIGIVFKKTQKTRTNVLKCIDNQKNILYNCFVIKESVGKRGIMAKTVEKDSALEQVLADIEKQYVIRIRIIGDFKRSSLGHQVNAVVRSKGAGEAM